MQYPKDDLTSLFSYEYKYSHIVIKGKKVIAQIVCKVCAKSIWFVPQTAELSEQDLVLNTCKLKLSVWCAGWKWDELVMALQCFQMKLSLCKRMWFYSKEINITYSFWLQIPVLFWMKPGARTESAPLSLTHLVSFWQTLTSLCSFALAGICLILYTPFCQLLDEFLSWLAFLIDF